MAAHITDLGFWNAWFSVGAWIGIALFWASRRFLILEISDRTRASKNITWEFLFYALPRICLIVFVVAYHAHPLLHSFILCFNIIAYGSPLIIFLFNVMFF